MLAPLYRVIVTAGTPQDRERGGREHRMRCARIAGLIRRETTVAEFVETKVFVLLPPAEGHCPICAAKHEPEARRLDQEIEAILANAAARNKGRRAGYIRKAARR